MYVPHSHHSYPIHPLMAPLTLFTLFTLPTHTHPFHGIHSHLTWPTLPTFTAPTRSIHPPTPLAHSLPFTAPHRTPAQMTLCTKFQANVFNKVKCQNCFKPKEQHSARALESCHTARCITRCGFMFVAPEQYDFNNPSDKTRVGRGGTPL